MFVNLLSTGMCYLLYIWNARYKFPCILYLCTLVTNRYIPALPDFSILNWLFAVWFFSKTRNNAMLCIIVYRQVYVSNVSPRWVSQCLSPFLCRCGNWQYSLCLTEVWHKAGCCPARICGLLWHSAVRQCESE